MKKNIFAYTEKARKDGGNVEYVSLNAEDGKIVIAVRDCTGKTVEGGLPRDQLVKLKGDIFHWLMDNGGI